MKRPILTILTILFCLTWSFAQAKTDLKGPAAKNYKPWMNKELPKTYVMAKRNVQQGPAFKNLKVWNDEYRNSKTIIIDMKSNPSKLQGPRSKNNKIWNKNS